MPQTQEEHFMALEDENDDSDSEPGATTRPDIEVRPFANFSLEKNIIKARL